MSGYQNGPSKTATLVAAWPMLLRFGHGNRRRLFVPFGVSIQPVAELAEEGLDFG